MSNFSERMGLAEPRSVIQRESIDEALRNKLWDLTALTLEQGASTRAGNSDDAPTLVAIWTRFFEMSRDDLPHYRSDARETVKAWFYASEWNEVYDLIEFCTKLPHVQTGRFVPVLNGVLERYLSAYRWVGDEIVPLTEEHEIASIETVLASPLQGVRVHISKALTHLANRSQPDVANSIKESISAVEAICSAIVGKPETLGAALKKLKDAGVKVHPALEQGWLKLYGYTSDADGIRHAMQGDSSLGIDDAVYFLVSCSAFVSLLTEKAQAAGIELQSAGRASVT